MDKMPAALLLNLLFPFLFLIKHINIYVEYSEHYDVWEWFYCPFELASNKEKQFPIKFI